MDKLSYPYYIFSSGRSESLFLYDSTNNPFTNNSKPTKKTPPNGGVFFKLSKALT